MNRFQRILQIHESLTQADKPRSAEEWADILNVPHRTVLRDMNLLKEELKAPLVFDSQLQGYRYEPPGLPLPSGGKSSKWARLFGLIHQIRTEPGRSARELAEALGCSQRSFFRDMHSLEEAGLPIVNDNGYRFVERASRRSFRARHSWMLGAEVRLRART